MTNLEWHLRRFIVENGVSLAFTGDSYDTEAISYLACDFLGATPSAPGDSYEKVRHALVELIYRGDLVALRPSCICVWTQSPNARPLFWDVGAAGPVDQGRLHNLTIDLIERKPIETRLWDDHSKCAARHVESADRQWLVG